MANQIQTVFYAKYFSSSFGYVCSVVIPFCGHIAMYFGYNLENNFTILLYTVFLLFVSVCVSLLLVLLFFSLLLRMEPDTRLPAVVRYLWADAEGRVVGVSQDWEESDRFSAFEGLSETRRITGVAPFINATFWFVAISSLIILVSTQLYAGRHFPIMLGILIVIIVLTSTCFFMYSGGYVIPGLTTIYADPSAVSFRTLWRERVFLPGSGLAVFRQAGLGGAWCRVLLVSDKGGVIWLRIRMSDADYLASLYRHADGFRERPSPAAVAL